MRLTFYFLTTLMIVTSTLYSQDTKKCDEAVILATKNKVGKLTKNDMQNFLMTFGKECRNNVEFSEFSNEVLFLVLDKQTDLALETLEKEEKQIELSEILDNLDSPISDAIAVKNLIPKVEKSKINDRLKKLVVDRLKTAGKE